MDPQQLMARLKALISSFQPAQLASLVVAFVLVVGIVGGSAWWMNTPTYGLLMADMDAEAASDVVNRLKALKVAYQLDEGGRAVRVPVERVDELRLELTSQGMPGSGRVGYEVFDRTAFGATEFQEHVNYQRALEGEIARTISTIAEVSNARVHITMGKDSLFGESRPAKASVLLKLRSQRSLRDSTINGITNLVASSVDGLRPEAVMILDSYGRPLARPANGDSSPGGAAQLERQQHLEQDMTTRLVALLEPVLGANRVRVNVAMKLNQATVEQTEDKWDPTTVLRSRQVTSDTTSTATPGGGVAGTRGNAPPTPPDPKNPTPPAPVLQTAATSTGAQRSAETTNYEVSRTTVVTQRPAGDVARLSVAVLVDDDQVVKKGADGQSQTTRKARTPEELQKIQGLVAAAVGLEPERGDTISVQNVSFEEPVVEDAPPLTIVQQVTRYSPQIWEGVRIVVVGLVGLFALLFFVRPLMAKASELSPGKAAQAAGVNALAAGGAGVRTVADLEQEIEAQLDATNAPKADSRRLPVLTRRASQLSAKEPENVAMLLRNWINEGER